MGMNSQPDGIHDRGDSNDDVHGNMVVDTALLVARLDPRWKQ